MKSRAALLVGALLALGCAQLVLGCDREHEATPSGALGVFYGGQIQELEIVEWGAERLPTLGFRVEWPEPRESSAPVKWQITRPGPEGRRVTELGSFEVPRDRTVFDQALRVAPDAVLGAWNVRVTVGERLVIDRALLLKRPTASNP